MSLQSIDPKLSVLENEDYGLVGKTRTLKPRSQIAEVAGHADIHTYPCTEIPSATYNPWASGDTINLRVSSGAVDKMLNAWLRLRITETSGSQSVRLLPTPMWFDRIEVRIGNQGDMPIYTFFPQQLLADLATTTVDDRNVHQRNSNFNRNWWLSTAPIQASGNEFFYLYFPNSFIEQVKPYLGDVKGQLIFTFYCNTQGIITSGSGTVALNSIDLQVRNWHMGDYETQVYHQFSNYQKRHNIVRCTRLIDTSRTLTNGQATDFSLQTLEGNFVSHIIFGVLAGTSQAPANGASMNYLSIGDEALVDIVDSSGQSVFGNGSAVRGKELEYLGYREFNNEVLDRLNLYCMPLTSRIGEVYAGRRRGGYNIKQGANLFLRITPHAGVSEVCSLTLANTNTQGVYQLSFDGQNTSSLAFNANAAAIKAALELTQTIRDERLTVTASGTAQGSFTITYSPPRPVDKVVNMNVVSLANVSNALESPTVAITTRGKKGYTNSGSACTLHVLAYCYSDFENMKGERKVLNYTPNYST